MTETIGGFTPHLVLTAIILTGSIGWILLVGRTLLPSRQNIHRSRRKTISVKNLLK